MKNFKFVALAMFVLFLLAACGGGSSAEDSPLLPQDKKGGDVKLENNSHLVTLDLSDGYIKGIVSGNLQIANNDVEAILAVSARIGSKENTIAIANVQFGDSISPATVTIPNTANSDEVQWLIRTRDKKFYWFNLDRWSISGKPWVKTAEGLVRYGSMLPSQITVTSDKIAHVIFGCNLVVGFVTPLKTGDVHHIEWRSDRVGWKKSSASGTVRSDTAGNIFADISGMPTNDVGNFAAVLHDGSEVWLNINGPWVLGSNVSRNTQLGQLEFVIF